MAAVRRSPEAGRTRKKKGPAPRGAGPPLAGRGRLAQRAENFSVTRRFCARPASVSLAAIGRLSPKPAELSRTRGEVGSVASLKGRWVGDVTDRAALDLEALRHYLPVAALQTALNGFIKAGGRDLRGAVIRLEQTASVR